MFSIYESGASTSKDPLADLDDATVQKKILIIEDETPVRTVLARRLRARGYLPVLCADVTSALAAFDAGRPEMVLISLTLPDDGGAEACRDIRSRPMGALVPIVFMGTGSEHINSVGAAIAAGGDHFAVKPEELEVMLSRVSRYIGPGSAVVSSPHTGPLPPLPTFVSQGIQEPQPKPAPEFEPDPDVQPGVEWSGLAPQSVQPTPAPAPLKPKLEQPEPVQPTQSTSVPLPLQPTPAQSTPVQPAAVQPAAVQPARGLRTAPPLAPTEEAEAAWWTVLDPGRSVPLDRRGIESALAAAMLAKLTGRFEISAGGVLRRVFFETGNVTYVDSSDPDEDLLASLAAEGKITRATLLNARRRAAETGAGAEESLIENGALKSDDLYRALRAHVIDRALALFAIEAGQGLVIRGGPRPVDAVDLGVHPGRLILDGTRRKFGRLRLYRIFGTPSAVPRPRLNVPLPTGFSLRPDEDAVYRTVDGQRSAMDIARGARVGEVDTLAILHGLAVLDLIESPSGRVASVLPPLDRAQLERADAPRSADEMPGFAELVGVKHDEARTANYYLILGVARDATQAEIKAAYETARQRFDPHRVRKDGPLHAAVTEICEVLDDGYAILSRPRLRARYASALRGR